MYIHVCRGVDTTQGLLRRPNQVPGQRVRLSASLAICRYVHVYMYIVHVVYCTYIHVHHTGGQCD